MKLLIHDLSHKDFEKIEPNPSKTMTIIEDNGTIEPCAGCFGCWIKTPGQCVLLDNYANLGEILSKCSQVVIISQCYYGGFSPFVKNILDRSISYLHPYFIYIDGEMHHQKRYLNQINLNVWFYGDDLTTKEKQTAQRIVYANSLNLHAHVDKIIFKDSLYELEGLIL